MSDPRIVVARDGAVATLTINRPEKLNAMDAAMMTALEEAAQALDADPSVRVVILTGAGEKSFCAGGDIEAWSGVEPHEFGLAWVRQGHRAFDALARMRQPLIAALNGHTLGGGLELAVTADFRIAESHVKIGLPETGIGIIPGWSGTQRAVRRFGAQVVRRMSVGAEMFDADAALSLGLVDQVAEKGQSLTAAKAWAERIVARGAFATAAAKLMINAAEGEEREAALEALGGIAAASHAELKTRVAEFMARKKK
ncbi:MAG: enoyl-CoA hydratase/isomerase family protein [Hyphomicrobiales bacterium]